MMAERIKFYPYGCRKDPLDLRDIPMGLVLPPIPLPKSLDWTARMSPVKDQGNEGVCVAFASVVGMKEYQEKKEYQRLIELSVRFVYNLCKKYDGAPNEEGTYPRMAMKILLNYGVCLESFWPYFPHQQDRPQKGAAKIAKKYKIKAYARLHTLLEMKRSLVVNGPFLAGVKVFSSWFKKRVQKNGLIPMPKSNEEFMGGHAVCIVGYNDAKETFKFKNSWGLKWADKGYGYLPYAYLRRYCRDAWSGTDLLENPKALVKKRAQVIAKFA
ncbi:MAG: C1 family peptidase [Candidatus Omnitrophota bacterium]|nr:C1 family peptidase [Candidatus Omnitrophota bacterium]